MQTIQTLEQLIEYKKKLERQQDCLSLDTVWSIFEKKQMLQCYNEMIAICEYKINNFLQFEKPPKYRIDEILQKITNFKPKKL